MSPHTQELTPKQSLALQLIGNVRQLPLNSARQAKVLSRVEKEFDQMKALPKADSSGQTVEAPGGVDF